MKKLLLFVTMFFFVGSFTSCTKINDSRLNTLEKSLNKLEQNYKNYSPEKLKREIEKCENQFEKLDQDKEKLTINQQQQFSKSNRKFCKILIKIWWNLAKSGLSEEYEEAIDYIKDLLKKRWNITDDITSLGDLC